MMAQGKVPEKLVKKTINFCIKQELSAQGIKTTTRQGNKELKFLIDKVARYTFNNQDEVRAAGGVSEIYGGQTLFSRCLSNK